MFQVEVHAEGMEAIVEALRALRFGLTDLEPLARRIAGIVRDDNAYKLLQGVDRDGVRFADLAPSTLARRAHAGAPRRAELGGPLAPYGLSSGPAEGFTVTVASPGVGHVVIVGEWPTTPYIQYHRSGVPSHNLPARDIVGLTPRAWDSIREAVRDFVRGRLDAFGLQE